MSIAVLRPAEAGRPNVPARGRTARPRLASQISRDAVRQTARGEQTDELPHRLERQSAVRASRARRRPAPARRPTERRRRPGYLVPVERVRQPVAHIALVDVEVWSDREIQRKVRDRRCWRRSSASCGRSTAGRVDDGGCERPGDAACRTKDRIGLGDVASGANTAHGGTAEICCPRCCRGSGHRWVHLHQVERTGCEGETARDRQHRPGAAVAGRKGAAAIDRYRRRRCCPRPSARRRIAPSRTRSR